MKTGKRRLRLFWAAAIIVACSAVSTIAAGGSVRKSSVLLKLGESNVPIAIYEKEGADITYFSPHHNEKIALELAKIAAGKYGGRLISIESYDDTGRPSRNLRFKVDGVSHSVDPNRIFTSNGRDCSGLSPGVAAAVENFAAKLVELLRTSTGPDLLVAVHNNTDSGRRSDKSRVDLTAPAFTSRLGRSANFFHQTSGVYLSNAEEDDDNFVFVSDSKLVRHFADRGFNVVVQKPAAQLLDKRCTIDDGSFSVYAGQNSLTYICLEADANSGSSRQAEMFEAVLAYAKNDR